jgi:hypothetical protein
MFVVQAVATLVVVLCWAGLMLIEIVTNNPPHWVPDPATGRVCPVFILGYPSYHHYYYTMPFDCSVSWSLATVGGIALLLGLLCKFAR